MKSESKPVAQATPRLAGSDPERQTAPVSFSWTPNGTPSPNPAPLFWTDALQIRDELFFYDRPRVFTFEDADQLFLAYQVDEVGHNVLDRHVLVKTSDAEVAAVSANQIKLISFFEGRTFWVVDTDARSGVSLRCWETDLARLGYEHLPDRDVYLSREAPDRDVYLVREATETKHCAPSL